MVVETLKKLFRPRHDYLPGVQVFSPIDVNRIKDEMKLVQRGKEDGARGVPTADATSLSGTEVEIVRKCENWRGTALAEARQTMEVYTSRLTTGMQGLQLAQLRPMVQTATHDLEQVAEDEIAELSEPVLEVKRRRNDFDLFRTAQKIPRAPHPEAGFWRTAMVVSLVALIEVAGNSFFFADAGNQFGILGAVVEAVVIPIANIGVATLLVFFGVRQLWRREWTRKFIGLVALLAFIGFAGGFNLAVAHYRDALGIAGHDAASAYALGTLTTTPLKLQSLTSWLLFCLGVLVTVVTLYEVISYRDPIPGYSRLERRRSGAVDAFNDSRADAIAGIQSEYDARRDELIKLRRRLAEAMGDAALMSERVDHLQKDLDEYRNYLMLTAKELAETYRENNRASRSTPVPNHFNQPIWHADEMRIDVAVLTAFKNELSELQSLKDGEDILETGLNDLNVALKGNLDRIKVLGDIEEMEPPR